MVTEAMKAGVRAFVRLLELDFDGKTIDRFFDVLRLVPKEDLEYRSIELRNKVEEREIPEEEFLMYLDELEAELTKPSR